MRYGPSTNTSRGRVGSAATARASAHSDARRMLSRSMREGGANATATSALPQILAYSFSRVSTHYGDIRDTFRGAKRPAYRCAHAGYGLRIFPALHMLKTGSG